MKLDKNTRIQEVIVVEGKDDTKRIKASVDADTIETRGSALSDETLAHIERLNDTRGVIVLCDPDFSGEKIRKQITQAIPSVKQAFITKAAAKPHHSHGSLGVEHASPQAIREALANVYTPAANPTQLISQKTLLDYHLISGKDAKARRALLGEILKIGYVNGKQLSKRLALFEIDEATLADAMKQVAEMMPQN